MVNPTGYTALDMIGFTDKGTYSSSANYVKNDLVHYSGNIWRCLVDDTSGIVPAEGVNWTLFIGEPTNLVERIIAPVETDPATSAWAVGRQIIYNDNLYEVITAITAGDSLVTYEDDPTNANIKLADPVETQVLTQKTQIQTLTNQADDMNNVLGAKNLLPNKAKSHTVGGVTFTVNKDGTITANGTYTSQDILLLSNGWNDNDVEWIKALEGKEVVISGSVDHVTITIQFRDSNGNIISAIETGYAGGSGSGIVPSGVSQYVVFLFPDSLITLSNAIFKPMIRLASITDDTYEPFAKTNPQLTEDTNAIEPMLNVLGAKNLLNPIDYYSMSSFGVTSVINSDGTVSLSGTATATENITITSNWEIDASNLFDNMVGQELILSDGTDANTFVGLMLYDSNGNILVHLYTQDGEMKFTISQKPAAYSIYYHIVEGVDYTGVVLKPMIRLASIQEDTYVPYAKTNQELTAEKANKSDFASISITGNTNNTGSKISKGTFFYKSGVFTRAILDIANGATLTENTNYKLVTDGGLNETYDTRIVDLYVGTLSATEASQNFTISLSPDDYKILAFYTIGTPNDTQCIFVTPFITQLTLTIVNGINTVSIVRTGAEYYGGHQLHLILIKL